MALAARAHRRGVPGPTTGRDREIAGRQPRGFRRGAGSCAGCLGDDGQATGVGVGVVRLRHSRGRSAGPASARSGMDPPRPELQPLVRGRSSARRRACADRRRAHLPAASPMATMGCEGPRVSARLQSGSCPDERRSAFSTRLRGWDVRRRQEASGRGHLAQGRTDCEAPTEIWVNLYPPILPAFARLLPGRQGGGA